MDCHAGQQRSLRHCELSVVSHEYRCLWVDELRLVTGLGVLRRMPLGGGLGWLGACPIGCALLGKGHGTFFCIIGAEHFLLKGNLHFPELVFFNAH